MQTEIFGNGKLQKIAIIDSCVDNGLEIKKILNPAYKIISYTSIKEFQVSIGNGDFPDILIIGLHDTVHDLTSELKILRDYIPIIMVVTSHFSDEIRKKCLMSGAMKVIGMEHLNEIPFNITSFWEARSRRIKTTQVSGSRKVPSG